MSPEQAEWRSLWAKYNSGTPSPCLPKAGQQTGEGRPELAELRLEPEYLFWARQLAAEQGLTFKALLADIDKGRDPQASLSSAIRVYVAKYLHDNPLQAA
jgi:Ribbon-helix-helix domain